MKRPNAISVLAFTLFMSMMVSAQAQAFDAGGLSYNVTDAVANTVEVTGRASGNTDTEIVIPSSVSDSGTTYAVTTIVWAFRKQPHQRDHSATASRPLGTLRSMQQPHQRDHSRQRHDH